MTMLKKEIQFVCVSMTNSTTITAKGPKRPVRQKRTWTPKEDEKLLDAMMELHASGKYAADNGFKPGYAQAIKDLLDVSLPNSGLQADPHIKSRLKTLKVNFGIMHDMVLGSSTSGFGWDPDKCLLTAPNDVWDAYLKTYPKAAVLRDKPFILYHKLSTIFGKDRASGSRAIDLGEEEAVSETETTPNDFEDIDIDMGVDPSPENAGGKGTKRKRCKTDELIHIYSNSCDTFNNTINAIGNEMNINLSKMANDQESQLQRDIDLMKRVQNEIDALPGITFEEAFEATNVIGKCPLKAEMLFGYDEAKKIRMVQMVARKST